MILILLFESRQYNLRSCVWASPPSRKSKRDRGEALMPTHPSAGRGLSTSWGAFLLNSSLAGFPREIYLCTACHPQKNKPPPQNPPKPDQKNPRQYLLSPDCWSIYLNNTKEIMSAFRTKASALGKKELNIVHSQAGISVEKSSGSKCPL